MKKAVNLEFKPIVHEEWWEHHVKYYVFDRQGLDITCAEFHNPKAKANIIFLTDWNESFLKYADIPVISLESNILHPLQSLTDMMVLTEMKTIRKPKVVLTWAPHPKAVPQVVANSFAEWTNEMDVDFVITHPKGFELDEQFTQNATIEYNQDKALENADFVYVKSWTSTENYGQVSDLHSDWTITKDKMKLTDNAYVMHCLPVRRNVEVTDEVLDHPSSLIYHQVKLREFAAQAVLSEILTNGNN